MHISEQMHACFSEMYIHSYEIIIRTQIEMNHAVEYIMV